MASSYNHSKNNYDLSYLLLLEAANEFQGYLMGLTNNNLITFANDPDALELYLNKIEADENDSGENATFNYYNTSTLNIFKKEILPNILDRTTGAYFTYDLLNSAIDRYPFKNILFPNDLFKYMSILYFNNNYKKVGTAGFQNAIPQFLDGTIATSTVNFEINDSIKHLSSQKLVKSNVTKINKDGQAEKVLKDPNDPKSPAKQYYSGVYNDPKNKRKIEDLKININKGSPNRFEIPQIASYTFKHYKTNFSRRNSNHLPIFLNAIPPLEMSRCVPYLDVKLVTRKFKNTSPMSNPKFFRFVKEEGENKFVLRDQVGYDNYRPVTPDFENFGDNYNVNYMDLFTSPQTMVNANINSTTADGIFGKRGNNDNPVLEPIMPFMSLESLNVSISGKGYGIMASKTANMILTLHDRSRLAEIAPLVASNQIAGTKIHIEYGWNHPEGGATSKNVIGKYLNALKEVSIFQVINSSYDFKGSEVKIKLKLAAAGFKQTNRVHIGSGPVVPTNVVQGVIDEVIDDLLAENNKGEKDKIREVRQQIRLNGNDAKSIYANYTWEQYSKVSNALKNKKEDYKELKETIKKIVSGEDVSDSVTGFINNQEDEAQKETMLKYLYGKLDYMSSDEFLDPYILNYVYGSKSHQQEETLRSETFESQQDYYTNTIKQDNGISGESDAANIGKHVTLGTVLSSLIAYPLASTCLFDEVQLIFYPINHQAGGARKYTTANFPIPLEMLKTQIQEKIKGNSRMTVQSFLGLLEKKILRNRSLYAYGLNTEYKRLEVINDDNSQPDSTKINIVVSRINGLELTDLGIDATKPADAELIKLAGSYGSADDDKKNEILSKKLTNKGPTFKSKCLKIHKNIIISKNKNQVNLDISSQLRSIYQNDELDNLYPASEKLTVPNLTLDYEVIPVAVPKDTLLADEDLTEGGIHLEKTMLRIHISDSQTVNSPIDHALIAAKTEGFNDTFDKKIADIAKKMSYSEIKQVIKRSYPTIMYGSSTATIDSISVSANSSGKLADVLIVESYGNIQNAKTEGRNWETPYEETILFPSQVSLKCAGMPMIGRGNNIFIDFGTNTTIDNIYTVISVDHTIKKGEFKSDIKLVPANIGAVSSFRDKLIRLGQKL